MQTENESDDGASVAGVPVFVNDVDISSAVGVPVFVNEYDNARVVGVPVFVEKGKAPRTRKAAASTEKKSEKSPCVPIFASESARARETASEQRRQSGASIVRGSFYATRGKTQPTDDEQSTIAKPAPTSSKKRGRPTKKPPAPLKPLSKRTMSRQNAENIVDTSDRSTRRKPALTQHQEIAKPARSRKQAKSSLENADPQSGTKRAPAFIGKLSISKNSATELTDPSDENDSDSLDVSEAFDEQESSGRVSLTNVGAELTRVQSKIKLVFPEYKSPWSEPNAMALFAEQHPDLKISDFLGMALKESKAQLEEACQEKIDLFYERAMKQL